MSENNIVSEPRPSGPERNFRANRLVHEIRLRNVLSFGPDTPTLRLGNLNVLIGPNGSGKSNLIEAIGLLRSTSGDMADNLRRSGGVSEWIWKGDPKAIAQVECVVPNPKGKMPVRHTIDFAAHGQQFDLVDERVENERPYSGYESKGPVFFYRYQRGNPVIKRVNELDLPLNHEDVEPNKSILAQRQDPHEYPVLTDLGRTYDRIALFREWSFGRNSVFRRPQDTAGRPDRLMEDFSNLGVFLNNRFGKKPKAKARLESVLRDLYEGVERYEVIADPKTLELNMIESGFDSPIPATRLSDGTLRFLALAAILLDPEPPPLVCIEEPELGLHPDVITKIGGLLIEASQRMQIIVTTHSDMLLDCMNEMPEAVVVCEKHDGKTTMERLDPERWKEWFADNMGLAELWSRGSIGGTRW